MGTEFIPSFAQEVKPEISNVNIKNNEVFDNEKEAVNRKRFTVEDFEFVKENCANMTVTQMAEARELTTAQVKRMISKAIKIITDNCEEGKITEDQKNILLIKFTPIQEVKIREKKEKHSDKQSISSIMDNLIDSLKI